MWYSHSTYSYPRLSNYANQLVYISWLVYGTHFLGGSFSWRFPLAFQIIFAIIVTILLLDLPESPRWLYKTGRQQEAVQTLCRVFDKPLDSDFIVQEKDSINAALELEAQEKGPSWLSLFRDDAVKTRRRVILAYVVMVCTKRAAISRHSLANIHHRSWIRQLESTLSYSMSHVRHLL